MGSSSGAAKGHEQSTTMIDPCIAVVVVAAVARPTNLQTNLGTFTGCLRYSYIYNSCCGCWRGGLECTPGPITMLGDMAVEVVGAQVEVQGRSGARDSRTIDGMELIICCNLSNMWIGYLLRYLRGWRSPPTTARQGLIYLLHKEVGRYNDWLTIGMHTCV